MNPEEDSQEFEELVRKVFETGESQRQEVVHENMGRYYDRTLTPVENPRTGEVDRVAVISKDITERIERERKLRKSEERFREFFENEPEDCYMVSPEGEIIDVNESALDTLGYRKGEIRGKPLLSTVYAPSSQEEARKLLEEWRKGKEIRDEELEILTKEEEKRTVLLSAASVKDDGGRFVTRFRSREI
ncbi:hypothetical protein AKJ51_00835 [candidate division MSBL1 archaeon SCGC-AAA382A20]|uniref:PAS domain-containing protein n=1 Tax=candidate division MSBL1 archaeon SCGC-AAA382A20 TaxID=1698280 RepID=A0A133VMA1_9EURY|nr:hypothetical protein AKJ51_00835 [candidate division MSBL1 archaeon SCGC-AAA382A20]